MFFKNPIRWSDPHGQKGSSLLSTVAISGVLGVSAMAVASRMNSTSTLGALNKGALAKDLVTFKIRKASYVNESYYNALQDPNVLTLNPDLYHCFSGQDTVPLCVTTDSTGAPIIHPIRLYSATDFASLTDTAPTAISDGGASDPNPVYWDIQGNACSGATASSCPFEVSTYFTATCQNGSSSCTQAYHFTLTYTVQVNPKVYASVTKSYGALASVTAQGPLYFVYQYYSWDWGAVMPMAYGTVLVGTAGAESGGQAQSAVTCSVGQVVVNGRCVSAAL